MAWRPLGRSLYHGRYRTLAPGKSRCPVRRRELRLSTSDWEQSRTGTIGGLSNDIPDLAFRHDDDCRFLPQDRGALKARAAKGRRPKRALSSITWRAVISASVGKLTLIAELMSSPSSGPKAGWMKAKGPKGTLRRTARTFVPIKDQTETLAARYSHNRNSDRNGNAFSKHLWRGADGPILLYE